MALDLAGAQAIVDAALDAGHQLSRYGGHFRRDAVGVRVVPALRSAEFRKIGVQIAPEPVFE